MAKELSWGREPVFEGMKIGFDYVSRTLGPKGTNVILDRGFSAPIITNDGVSTLEALEVDNFTQKQGLDLLKHGAKKQREYAGDGTTTFTVLTYALIEEGLKYDNPMELRRSLEKAVEKVVGELEKLSKPVKTDKEILHVATIATESEELGAMILDIIKAIGREGVISVEQSQMRETQVKIAEGYVVEKGYANNATGKAEINNAKVLVIGEKVQSIHDITPILDKCVQDGMKDLMLFCPDIETEALNAIAGFWKNNIIRVLVVKANTQNQEVLRDVAIVTGADFVSSEEGYRIQELQLSSLGKAGKIVSYNGQTTIVDGAGKTKKKVAELKEELKNITDPNDFDLAEKRIARLNHEVAVISVGAATEEAMQYLFYKIQNGVNSTKASIEEGIVEGGGMTLHRIADTLGNTIGEQVMKKALKRPLKLIIENGKEDYTDILLNMPQGKGYNAKSGEYADLIKDGVIDPVKVERFAVENATSLAASFLTTHGSIALKRKLED